VFAREDARVVFCSHRQNLGAKAERGIRAMGGEATYTRADVRKADEVKVFVDACVAKYGRLDIAYNAGNDYPPKPIVETGIAEFDDLPNNYVRGIFLSIEYKIPYMQEVGGGAIINMASIGGHRAFPITGRQNPTLSIKRIKTKWRSCNIAQKRIWLNLELVKKTIDCLEYVLIHELVHLLECNYKEQFKAYIDFFSPKCQQH
jgi:NAD(P)-dependent dehydrogenase (short-subunit alcohol dehydrogenase family)